MVKSMVRQMTPEPSAARLPSPSLASVKIVGNMMELNSPMASGLAAPQQFDRDAGGAYADFARVRSADSTALCIRYAVYLSMSAAKWRSAH
jgi:hypothetical protein